MMEDLIEENKHNANIDNDEHKIATKENDDAQNGDTLNEAPGGDVSDHGMQSYLDQWKDYFDDHGSGTLMAKLKSKTFKDSLRSCHFRSVCWRVFLGCLSEDVSKWDEEIAKSRDEYRAVKEKHVTNPHDVSQAEDPEQENPLSQSDNSLWQQFFKNSELKNIIDRDVRRTCPEMDFFHHEKIKDLLANILFCYAREHAALSYRQGMHELLAPLVFVLHCDLQGAAHAQDMGTLPDIISTVLKEEYLEHDAYAMFCQVMDATNAWYAVTEQSKDEEEIPSKGSETSPIQTVPFQAFETNTSNPTLAITNKLNYIHCTLLAHYDVELYQHLNRLEIIPQVYGLRWVRLLFGREFDLQDLLVLWDALFADSRSLDLVDYIFVAMMHNIRQDLLAAEYCTCMRLLMKYPPIEDIYDMLRLAMYYRNPQKNKPPLRARLKPLSGQKNFAPTEAQNLGKKKILPTFNNPFSNWSKSIKNSIRTPQSTSSTENNALQPGNPTIQRSNGNSNDKMRLMTGLVGRKSKIDGPDQHDISDLKQQLNELQDQCRFCSDKIEASIRLLQPHFVKLLSDPTMASDVAEEATEALGNGDRASSTPLKNAEPLVALANLKQVRDVLRGSLNMEMCSPGPDALARQIDGLPNPPDSPPREAKKCVELDPTRQRPGEDAVPRGPDPSTPLENTTSAPLENTTLVASDH